MVRRIRKKSNNGDSGLGKLFYATILTNQECNFGSIGLNNQRVHSINYRDVGALMSDYPRVDKIKLLRKYLAPYHRVVREAAKLFTTIPARFGQIARDAGEVSIVLQRNYDRIRRELDRLDGKVEMGIKARWDVENLRVEGKPVTLFEYSVERDEALRTRRDKLQTKGTPSRAEQIDFGRYFHDRIEHARREITERVLAALPPAEVRLDDVFEDNMATNATLLIEKDLLKQLEGAVDALGESMGDEYSLKLDGPWPPFSFVDRLELHLSYS